MTSKNDCISFHFRRIFSIKAFQAPFLPKFPQLARKRTEETRLPKKRNVCTLISGTIFVKSKHIKRFCEGLHTFCPNLHRFWPDFKGISPDFYQIKIFGRGLSPSAPPPPTPLALNLLLKTFTQLVWMPEKVVLPQTHLIRFAWSVRIQRSPHPWRRLSLKLGILQ